MTDVNGRRGFAKSFLRLNGLRTVSDHPSYRLAAQFRADESPSSRSRPRIARSDLSGNGIVNGNPYATLADDFDKSERTELVVATGIRVRKGSVVAASGEVPLMMPPRQGRGTGDGADVRPGTRTVPFLEKSSFLLVQAGGSAAGFYVRITTITT